MGRTVNMSAITIAFSTAPTMINGLYLPALKWLFSIMELISRSLTASHIMHTTMVTDITVNCITSSFIVYWMYVRRNMLTRV